MTPKRPMIHCADCGEWKPTQGKARCVTCYSRVYRNSMPITTCANCACEKRIRCRGLCQACYLYQHRHGTPRPLSLIYRRPKPKKKPKPKPRLRLTDNRIGSERQCLKTGCINPAIESAPWGLGFCETCMPQVQKALASHQGLVRKSAA